MKNRYVARSRVSEAVFRRFLRHVAVDLTAVQIARLTRLNRNTVIHSDGFKSYDGLVDMGYKKHLRVDHSKNEFSSRRIKGNHINGIEGFWGYAKTRLARFCGINRNTFLSHLKECEFRYNHRHTDLYKALLLLCRKHPLS